MPQGQRPLLKARRVLIKRSDPLVYFVCTLCFSPDTNKSTIQEQVFFNLAFPTYLFIMSAWTKSLVQAKTILSNIEIQNKWNHESHEEALRKKKNTYEVSSIKYSASDICFVLRIANFQKATVGFQSDTN